MRRAPSLFCAARTYSLLSDVHAQGLQAGNMAQLLTLRDCTPAAGHEVLFRASAPPDIPFLAEPEVSLEALEAAENAGWAYDAAARELRNRFGPGWERRASLRAPRSAPRSAPQFATILQRALRQSGKSTGFHLPLGHEAGRLQSYTQHQ